MCANMSYTLQRNQWYGYIGEWLCICYLQHSGYALICKNYRCKSGEIDSIFHCQQKTCLFVEVKTTMYYSIMTTAHRICSQKQKRIIAASQHFMYHNQEYYQFDIRYDVMLIYLPALSFVWLKNAFQNN